MTNFHTQPLPWQRPSVRYRRRGTCKRAQEAIATRFDLALAPIERSFIYMPFMHAENLEDPDESVLLLRTINDPDSDPNSNLRYAEHHREVIRRFDPSLIATRILGRLSTAAEEEFLARESNPRYRCRG